MSDATITGQIIIGASSIMTIVGVGGGLWWQSRSARDKAEEKAEARTKIVTDGISAAQRSSDERMSAFEQATDVRLRVIEQTLGEHAGQFMPRDHIMQEFRHEKQNRQGAEAQIVRMHEGLVAQVRDIGLNLVRTTEQTSQLSISIGKVEEAVRDVSRGLDSRFDKLFAALGDRRA